MASSLTPESRISIGLLAGILGVSITATPDRWQVTGGRGQGDFEGWDYDETRLEVGVSGPIGSAQTASSLPHRCRSVETAQQDGGLVVPKNTPPLRKGQVGESDSAPWELLLTALVSVGGTLGAQKGHKVYQRRKASR